MKYVPIAFCLGFILVHVLGCSAVPDWKGTPDKTPDIYTACDGGGPWNAPMAYQDKDVNLCRNAWRHCENGIVVQDPEAPAQPESLLGQDCGNGRVYACVVDYYAMVVCL